MYGKHFKVPLALFFLLVDDGHFRVVGGAQNKGRRRYHFIGGVAVDYFTVAGGLLRKVHAVIQGEESGVLFKVRVAVFSVLNNACRVKEIDAVFAAATAVHGAGAF